MRHAAISAAASSKKLFRRHETDESTFYGDTLWTFLALELWHNLVVDQPIKVRA